MTTDWEYAKQRLAALMGVEPDELETNEPEEDIPDPASLLERDEDLEVEQLEDTPSELEEDDDDDNDNDEDNEEMAEDETTDAIELDNSAIMTFDNPSIKRFIILRKAIQTQYPNAKHNSGYGDDTILVFDPEQELMGFNGTWTNYETGGRYEAQVLIERGQSDEMPETDTAFAHPLNWKYLTALSKDAKKEDIQLTIGTRTEIRTRYDKTEYDETSWLTTYESPKVTGLESVHGEPSEVNDLEPVRIKGNTQLEVHDIGELAKRATLIAGVADMAELKPTNTGMTLIAYNNKHDGTREDIITIKFDDDEVTATGTKAFKIRSEALKALVNATDRKGHLELRWSDKAICAVHRTNTEDRIHFEMKWTTR
jgi:hypothetical protein